MILGVVHRERAAPPEWFSALALESAGNRPRALGEEVLSLGFGSGASHHCAEGLTVVAESSSAVTPGCPDAAAVGAAYRRYGLACARRLTGRIRFILHDAEARCLLATSSMGAPWPLAYWTDSRTTVVSSQALAILRCPAVPRALDDSYLTHLVLGLSAMREGSTILRDVKRLCPGESILVDSTGVRVSRLDHLVPRHLGGDRAGFGPALVDELERAAAPVVERGRTALSLSGGLDSAAIAGAVLRRVPRLDALSFVAPSLDPTAEASGIDAMERAWQRLAVTRVDASCAAELHDEGLSLPDDPILTPLALLPARMLLWSRAREDGIQTIIEGEGGDELFGILPTPLDALRRGHLVDAVVQVVRSSGRRSLAQNGLFLPWLPEVVQRSWLASRQPLEAHLPAFSLWEAHQHPAVREAVLQHLATLVHRPFPESVNEWLSAPAFVGATLTRRHFAASVGLELAWPMLDRPVLELLLGLHAAGALRGGPQKPFLQAALAGVVPDPVRTAEKNTGLYEAFIRRILASPRSREALRDARVRRRLSGLVRFERIDAMLDGLAQGRSLGPAPLWQLECVVSFARWYARASRELGVD